MAGDLVTMLLRRKSVVSIALWLKFGRLGTHRGVGDGSVSLNDPKRENVVYLPDQLEVHAARQGRWTVV